MAVVVLQLLADRAAQRADLAANVAQAQSALELCECRVNDRIALRLGRDHVLIDFVDREPLLTERDLDDALAVGIIAQIQIGSILYDQLDRGVIRIVQVDGNKGSGLACAIRNGGLAARGGCGHIGGLDHGIGQNVLAVLVHYGHTLVVVHGLAVLGIDAGIGRGVSCLTADNRDSRGPACKRIGPVLARLGRGITGGVTAVIDLLGLEHGGAVLIEPGDQILIECFVVSRSIGLCTGHARDSRRPALESISILYIGSLDRGLTVIDGSLAVSDRFVGLEHGAVLIDPADLVLVDRGGIGCLIGRLTDNVHHFGLPACEGVSILCIGCLGRCITAVYGQLAVSDCLAVQLGAVLVDPDDVILVDGRRVGRGVFCSRSYGHDFGRPACKCISKLCGSRLARACTGRQHAVSDLAALQNGAAVLIIERYEEGILLVCDAVAVRILDGVPLCGQRKVIGNGRGEIVSVLCAIRIPAAEHIIVARRLCRCGNGLALINGLCVCRGAVVIDKGDGKLVERDPVCGVGDGIAGSGRLYGRIRIISRIPSAETVTLARGYVTLECRDEFIPIALKFLICKYFAACIIGVNNGIGLFLIGDLIAVQVEVCRPDCGIGLIARNNINRRSPLDKRVVLAYGVGIAVNRQGAVVDILGLGGIGSAGIPLDLILSDGRREHRRADGIVHDAAVLERRRVSPAGVGVYGVDCGFLHDLGRTGVRRSGGIIDIILGVCNSAVTVQPCNGVLGVLQFPCIECALAGIGVGVLRKNANLTIAAATYFRTDMRAFIRVRSSGVAELCIK